MNFMNVLREKKDENKNPKTQSLCKQQNEWHFQIFLKHCKPSGLSQQLNMYIQ